MSKHFSNDNKRHPVSTDKRNLMRISRTTLLSNMRIRASIDPNSNKRLLNWQGSAPCRHVRFQIKVFHKAEAKPWWVHAVLFHLWQYGCAQVIREQVKGCVRVYKSRGLKYLLDQLQHGVLHRDTDGDLHVSARWAGPSFWWVGPWCKLGGTLRRTAAQSLDKGHPKCRRGRRRLSAEA